MLAEVDGLFRMRSDLPRNSETAAVQRLELRGAALFAASISNVKLGIAASELTLESVSCHLQRSINDAEAAQSRIPESSL
jgi:hypothetical protein